jgi:quinol monooxygenase YgiN
MMTRFVVIATVDVAEGRMEEIIPLLLAHRDRCLKDEPGTLRFEILRPNETENKLMAYEEYQDEAAFQTHSNGASLARVVAETAGMIANLDTVDCSIMD